MWSNYTIFDQVNVTKLSRLEKRNPYSTVSEGFNLFFVYAKSYQKQKQTNNEVDGTVSNRKYY